MVPDVNRLWAAVIGVLGFVVVLPLAVLVGSSLGVPTVHWSGVSLAGADPLPKLGVAQGSPSELDAARLAHLQSVQDAAIDLKHPGLFMTYTSYRRDQVVVETTALSHGLFTDLGDRFGGDVTVFYSPLQSMAHLDVYRSGDGSGTGPSWWAQDEPLATWWLLVTGFPWYIGATALVELGVFLRWRRRNNAGSTTPQSA
jgi:hypothetical protein